MIEPAHDILVQTKGAVYDKSTNGLYNYIMPDEIKNTIRCGKVLYLPPGYDGDVIIGDIIHFHHNITAPSYSMDNSGEVLGSFEIDRTKGLYHCPATEVFAFERDGVVKSTNNYCFIKPVQNDHVKEKGGLFTVDKNKEIPYVGILKHGNEHLKSIGLEDGAVVAFAEWTMYEFPIHGEKLYRMTSDKIIGKVHYE
ncbi:MAG: hypothetical protein ACEPOW_13735 [Bacteroidales bacterium]